jgi:hypothetical protein
MLVMFFVECLFVTHHAPRVFPLVVFCPKDTARCGEASSPHDVIDVVIAGENTKAPAGGLTPAGAGLVISGS